jgi:hypothetical protein
MAPIRAERFGAGKQRSISKRGKYYQQSLETHALFAGAEQYRKDWRLNDLLGLRISQKCSGPAQGRAASFISKPRLRERCPL